MHSVIPHVLRRMRAPLLLLIGAYAIATLGLVLIPGRTDAGLPYRMDFFHAFYVVSYTATTIGFGELPYAFTGAQRLWVVCCVYLTVIAWFYAIGTVVAMIREPAFGQAVVRNRFRGTVRRLREPFHLICGYGDTGSLLVRALTDRGRRAVVIDIDPQRITELNLTDLPADVPGLSADAHDTDALLAAGLAHPCCTAVLAVTNDDHANLQVAINAKLLNPRVRVICRADSREAAHNMESFGTDHVINPFDAFADNLTIAMRSPDLYRIAQWLIGLPKASLAEIVAPPRGPWIVCGYGRMGQAAVRYLGYEGIPVTLIGARDRPDQELAAFVHGKGTEAVTLREASIADAVGLLAASPDDADNLSIVLTARALKPELFQVARQNKASAGALFACARLDMIMMPSRIIATRMLSLLAAPLLPDFLRLARHQRPEWAERLARHLEMLPPQERPQVWALTLDERAAPALCEALGRGEPVTLGAVLRDPRQRQRELPAMALLLVRDKARVLLPEAELPLRANDQLLLVGAHGAPQRLNWTLRNYNALRYTLTGEQRPDGWLWRRLNRPRD